MNARDQHAWVKNADLLERVASADWSHVADELDAHGKIGRAHV